MDAENGAGERREPVRVEGCLRECRAVEATVDGRAVAGLTATVEATRARYGEAYHVTFPAARDLDLWVGAVMQAWAEAQAQRKELIAELPEWMRPRSARNAPAQRTEPIADLPEWLRPRGAPDAPARAGGLRVIVWGSLRCGRPIPPTGVRPATVLAARAQFPGLDAEVLCRAEELWRAARTARARKERGNG